MRGYGARPVTVTATQAGSNANLVGGPLRLLGWSMTDGTADEGLTARGTANAPAAGATIASIALPSGDFTVEWTVELTGTPGAGDVDNVALFIGAVQVAQSSNLGAVGQYPQESASVSVAAGPVTLAAKAIGNAVAGSVYTVNLTILPIGQSQASILDGGQLIGVTSMGEGRADSQWLGDYGVAIRTGLSVKTVQGAVSGVLWVQEIYNETMPDTRESSGG